MKIDIKSKDIELTEPLREYVDNKIGGLDKYLKRFDPSLVRADVEVSRLTKHHKTGDVFYAEVNLELPGGFLRATHKDKDIRMAIDKVRDVLQREIRKHKDKIES
ncbi:MAG: ribosomal subunit interface protein [Candidatus Colwellbacteria bacterium CG10_big_fil_rev_8_21_14_0_10_41_28]|uniref:Ribosomal subunit interface protein n=1 Tax=Candidatus Colwellbacteria bacterium CG10_big_fil_rev_8_21_14_0_10_41_28 TaxID=1974539 RepID=A0A2H0VK47_9BACT|nr:MAG: ribosomal subunit interface protein [Candidatus Colwellbacteria bacterium CG10_big_fil_rev_8_21_14_0_10_41_28]